MNKQELLKNFGQEIQKLRVAKGLSQEKLAHEIGVHRTYIGFIERGERNPTLYTIFKIAQVLGLKLKDLFNIVD